MYIYILVIISIVIILSLIWMYSDKQNISTETFVNEERYVDITPTTPPTTQQPIRAIISTSDQSGIRAALDRRGGMVPIVNETKMTSLQNGTSEKVYADVGQLQTQAVVANRMFRI